jgi:hypothetical protein
MSTTSPNRPARRMWWGVDRNLALLLGGAVALIIAGLIAVPLTAQRTPVLAAETTPEGVVQRFYQALYDGDYTTAYGYLAPPTQQKVSLVQLQESLQFSLQNSHMRVGSVNVNGDTATVQVNITSLGSGGLFGANEYTNTQSILLVRAGETWKLRSGFGVYFQD